MRRLNAAGLSVATLRSMAADAGIRITRLDPLCKWVPSWEPTNMNGAFIADHSIEAIDFFRMAVELGVSVVCWPY
jgi:hypothetical protein